jgi:TonB family protein
MKLIFSRAAVLLLSSFVSPQSGRKAKEIRVPAAASPAPEETKPKADLPPDPLLVTAERNEDYRCLDDGSLARLLGPPDELVISSKNVDERAVIVRKPAPSYTREARRTWVQGIVTLRLLLSRNKEISRIRIVKGLRAGLTENAIRAACKITFKPAMKDGQPVSQWVETEYVFRLY